MICERGLSLSGWMGERYSNGSLRVYVSDIFHIREGSGVVVRGGVHIKGWCTVTVIATDGCLDLVVADIEWELNEAGMRRYTNWNRI